MRKVPGSVGSTRHVNVLVAPGRSAPSAHVFAYAVSPPEGPVSTIQMGRDVDCTSGSLVVLAKAAAAVPVQGWVSGTEAFGTVRGAALRTAIRIVVSWAMCCER